MFKRYMKSHYLSFTFFLSCFFVICKHEQRVHQHFYLSIFFISLAIMYFHSLHKLALLLHIGSNCLAISSSRCLGGLPSGHFRYPYTTLQPHGLSVNFTMCSVPSGRISSLRMGLSNDVLSMDLSIPSVSQPVSVYRSSW